LRQPLHGDFIIRSAISSMNTTMKGKASSASGCSSNTGLPVSASKPVCTRRVTTSPLARASVTRSL